MSAPIEPTPIRSFIEPGARLDRRRPLPVQPTHVALSVELDPSQKTVSGQVTHSVIVLAATVSAVPLDAMDMTVTRATVDGEERPVIAHANGVDVLIDPPLEADETAEITLWFEARPTLGLYFVDGETPQAWTQGAMEDHQHWFPCFDAPQHMVTSEVSATVPRSHIAVSNGEPLTWAEEVDTERHRFHWRHTTPHALYLLTLVVDDLVELKREGGPVTLIDYVPRGREDDARALFARVPEMIHWIGTATGRPYPYPRYGHVFLRDFMWGGMENTTLTSLTDNALVPARYVAEEELERLVAHELAHQWFGDLIAPRGWPQIWLNESFATYFDILTMGALDGESRFVDMLTSYRSSYLEDAAKRYVRPVVTRRYVHPYVLFDTHAYEKGALTLHTLRAQLGEYGFWRGLRLYVKRCAGTAAETADLRRAFEDATGADLTDFFEQFIYRSGHIELKVEWSWRPAVGLELQLTRTDDGPQALDVSLAINAAGETRRQTIHIAPGQRTQTIACPHPPAWVALDPEAHCLVEIDESAESDRALAARLDPAQAPTALRLRTARLLGERGTAANTRVLAECAKSDPAWVVRMGAAEALGAHRSEASRKALLDIARDDDHVRVRCAAGANLGHGADGGWVKTIEGLLAEEQSPRVRAALLTGIGAIRDAAAATVLRRHLDHRSPRERIAAAAIGGLAAQDDTDAVDELALRTEKGHPKGVRRAALAGLARLGKIEGIDRKVARRIRETIEARLTDSEFHVRISAVKAAAALGQKSLVEPLRRAHGSERFALVQRYIREAIGQLEGTQAPAAKNDAADGAGEGTGA